MLMWKANIKAIDPLNLTGKVHKLRNSAVCSVSPSQDDTRYCSLQINKQRHRKWLRVFLSNFIPERKTRLCLKHEKHGKKFLKGMQQVIETEKREKNPLQLQEAKQKSLSAPRAHLKVLQFGWWWNCLFCCCCFLYCLVVFLLF